MELINNIFLFLLAIISTLIYFIILEKYTKNIQPEYARRLSHIGGSTAAILFSYILPHYTFILVLLSFVIIMFVSKRKKFFIHIHSVTRTTFGEELLPLGFLFAFVIVGGDFFLFALCVLIIGIADPVTGIVLQHYHSHLFGFLTFFSITFFILSFTPITLLTGLILSATIAFIERISTYGTDNLTVPVATSILLIYFI